MTTSPSSAGKAMDAETFWLLSQRINAAEAFARRAHAGQTDKGGAPYTGHLGQVAARARAHAERLGFGDEVAALCAQVGWLHDTIEDTDTTADDLRAAGFGAAVRAVLALSRPEGPPYLAWIQAIADSGDLVPIIVKLADNEDNLDPSRELAGAGSLRERYEASAAILRAALDSVGEDWARG
ncbi:phosphohydrolase [Methylorubrum sp. SB2]|uniref:phosphohydrolase n=1 Tax=Methylorubrum subtropicum TaxID=3138812 RepID=UPI00313ED352